MSNRTFWWLLVIYFRFTHYYEITRYKFLIIAILITRKSLVNMTLRSFLVMRFQVTIVRKCLIIMQLSYYEKVSKYYEKLSHNYEKLSHYKISPHYYEKSLESFSFLWESIWCMSLWESIKKVFDYYGKVSYYYGMYCILLLWEGISLLWESNLLQ